MHLRHLHPSYHINIAVVLGLTAILNSHVASGQEAPSCDPKAFEVHFGSWGVDTSGQDKNVHPGDDFAMYAWGKWYRETEIPTGAPAVWNRMQMMRRNAAKLRCTIEMSAREPNTENRRLIANLYRSYMNVDRVEEVGDAPLKRDVDAVKKLSDKSAFARAMGESLGSLGLGLFRVTITPRQDNPSEHIPRLNQSGLGMGSREFYLEPKNSEGRAAYEQYAKTMLQLISWPEPEVNAKQIIALETRIADPSWTQTQSDDLTAIWNPMTLEELRALAPGFEWDAYLKGAGLGSVKTVSVSQKSAFPKIAQIFADTPLETLKAWTAFHKANKAAPYLSSKYQQAHFGFWGKMQGDSEPQPRADSAVDVVSEAVVHPVSQEYMALYFSPKIKADIEAMVTNIKAGMRERLNKVDWMGPQTKKEALAKLDALHVGIGHPDKWRDFSGLHLREDDLYGNMQAVSRFNWEWTVGKLKRPVDRNEWIMEPFALGAMAQYPRNLLTFSAGFFQPPKYDPTADPAVNYGAIGADIGHEIGHFFDAGGATFDSTSRLRNWWTPEDATKFQQKVDKFTTRLNSYKEETGEPVNGKAALREQMAHYTGLEAALAGYHLSVHGKPAPVIDGLTGDQRFFLSYAQMWQCKPRPDFRKQFYDQPPIMVVINDVVRNMDGWYAAFDVKPNDKLYLDPEERARIW